MIIYISTLIFFLFLFNITFIQVTTKKYFVKKDNSIYLCIEKERIFNLIWSNFIIYKKLQELCNK